MRAVAGCTRKHIEQNDGHAPLALPLLLCLLGRNQLLRAKSLPFQKNLEGDLASAKRFPQGRCHMRLARFIRSNRLDLLLRKKHPAKIFHFIVKRMPVRI